MSLFTEHCLSGLFEIATALVVELLLRVRRSSLSLGILQRLVLKRRRRLLHTHHSSGCSRLFRHHRRWRLLQLRLRLLADDIEHTSLQRLLVLAQMILLPSVVEHLRIKTVTPHALVEQTYAVFVIRLLLELQAAAVFHVLFEFDRATAA